MGKVQGVMRKYRPFEVYVLLLVTFYFLFMDWEIGDRLRLYSFEQSPVGDVINGIRDLSTSDKSIYWSVVILYWFVGITRANKISNFIWQPPEELR